jgi:cAMP-dependent protein kinase regulator
MTNYVEKVDKFLAVLREDILKAKPSDFATFVCSHLSTSNHSSKGQDNDFRKALDQFQLKATSSASDDQDTIDSTASEQRRQLYENSKGTRAAFSAESISVNEVESFVPPRNPKSPEEQKRLAKSLSGIVLFSAMSSDNLQVLYDAFFECRKKKGDQVIRQGDVGDYFYVVDSGTCEVWKQLDPQQKPVLVKTCHDGDYFGELALIFGTPRAATVTVASESCRLWAIDRLSYRKIIMGLNMQKRARYESILKTVPLLSSMDNYERLTIADALQPKDFKAGEVIVKQGDLGQEFYLLLSGTCRVWKNMQQDGGKKQQVVELLTLKDGDFFGELALLFNEPRAATVEALSDVKTACLDAKSFKSLLGPLESILKRHSSSYEFYMSKKQ